MTEPAGRWRRLRQPSLTRRVLLALTLAVSLSFVVLLAIDWLDLQTGDAGARALPGVTRAMALSLPAGATPADAQAAIAVVRAADRQLHLLRQESGLGLGEVRLRLERATAAAPAAAPLYESPDTPPASAAPDASAILAWAGTRYWVASHRTADWQLTLYEPAPPETTLLRWLGADLLLPYLIALPIVMLPLWWAVVRGLRPLHGFVEQMRARSPDDPRPLALDLRYAELQPLGSAFEALLARVRASLQRERQLVQDAAHELRTPLAVIGAQAHALAHAADAAERARAQAALDRAVERSAHLVHQLLTLAALDDASPAAAAALVDLVALVQQHLAGVAPLAQARDIELALDSPDRLMAAVEPAVLHSILDNLVGNALRYVPDGAQVLVSLAAPAGDAAWVLGVADDGPGIAPQEQARLFERFQRGRDARASGSGLGLAIVRQAVQRLGGQIRVGPGLGGRGVSFEVRVGEGVRRQPPARARPGPAPFTPQSPP
ncbi:ATP-binding protein [Derxia lacustris]|uniref:ATP-binding protein n=1 Tax=Derxia lacustris TaxID=764842 RepID=UPI000A170B0A|nr:ATP-binding protein [Derxia lacustris]